MQVHRPLPHTDPLPPRIVQISSKTRKEHLSIMHVQALRRSPAIIGVISVVVTLLLVGGITLAFLFHHSPRAFAATIPTVLTCAQSPSSEHCDGLDPQVQGCAADAQTLGQADITQNGIVIGSVERRWSAKCQSWWGRLVDIRPGSKANMFVTVNGSTLSASAQFQNNNYSILYSRMVYTTTPSQPFPAITGELDSNGITTPPSATLPLIPPPGIAS